MYLLSLAELTLRDIVTNIPHDAGAVIVYVMLGTFGFLMWKGSRRRSPRT